jgi:hypothetical protein
MGEPRSRLHWECGQRVRLSPFGSVVGSKDFNCQTLREDLNSRDWCSRMVPRGPGSCLGSMTLLCHLKKKLSSNIYNIKLPFELFLNVQ